MDRDLTVRVTYTRRVREGRPERVESLLARISERVRVEECGCWTWTGPHSGNGRGGGYPRMSVDGYTVAVHRYVWMLFNGPLPSRKQLDHTCRNRMCVNPDHLETVTNRENARRRDAARGECNDET